MNDALRFADVAFAYSAGAPLVLDGVRFSLEPGARAALLGHNGAGKSTLMRLVTGLLTPARGAVWVGDWNTREQDPARLARRVGSVFQHADRQLFARTVREDVAFGPRALGVGVREVDRRVHRALTAVGLEAHAEEHPYDLPSPWRKLAALAGALALEPALLVLDEPTGGLDRRAREQVARALAERAAEGTAALVITHDLGFAADVLDRALVLERGRLAYDASLAALFADGGRLDDLGLVPPPPAALAAALRLPGLPIESRAVTAALGERCRP
jgi:energy-coupling factor transporter ATP-binding protein EcfA2